MNFDFDPPSFRLGMRISLAAVVGVVVLTLYALARRPRRRGDTTSTPPANLETESSMG